MLQILLVIPFIIVSTAAFGWEMITSRSPVDDSLTVVAILQADGIYQNRYGRTGRANIQILCEENRTGLAIVLPELYTSQNGGLGKVTFRVDDESAFDKNAIAANDHGSLALIGREAIQTIKELLGHNRLFVRVLTVSEPAKNIYFTIDGIDRAATPVRRECGW